MARTNFIRRSDLIPAFEAARAAGYDHVSITVETSDGYKFHIFAGNAPEATYAQPTALQKWRAGRAS